MTRDAPRRICALETSTRPPSIALTVDGRLYLRELEAERRHASDLLPALAELLEEAGCSARELELICVGTGPGSYTGLRVGIATAQGLARGTGAALVGVPSVAARAFLALRPGERGTVLIDARARALYSARFERGETELRELDPPRVQRKEDLELVSGDILLADEDALRAAGLEPLPDGVEVRRTRARADAVAELALRQFLEHGGDRPETVEPLYLRPFAATVRRR